MSSECFVSRTVSRCSTTSPRRTRARTSSSSPRRSGGTISDAWRPMAATAGQPNIRSAARFQEVMVPSTVVL